MKQYWIPVLLVLILFTTLLAGCGSKKQADPEEVNPRPQMQEDPDTLVCNSGKITLRFHKEEDRWVWYDDVDFPLDQSYVQDILDTIQDLRELTPIAHAKGLDEYGLEAAKAYVMLGDANENVSYIYIGKATDDGYYIYDGNEEDGIYVAPKTLMKQISRSIYDMARLPKLPQLTMENMTAMDLIAGEKELHSTANDGAWYSEKTDVTEKMANVTEALSQLKVTACVDFRPASGAADICGLTEKATVLTIGYGNDMTFTLTIGAKRNDDGYYATINEDSTIYLLPVELAKPIKTLAKDGL